MGTLISTILDFFFLRLNTHKKREQKAKYSHILFKGKQTNKQSRSWSYTKRFHIISHEIGHFNYFNQEQLPFMECGKEEDHSTRKQRSQINGRPSLCSKTFPKVKVKSIPVLWIPNWPETKARLTLRKRFVLKTIFPEGLPPSCFEKTPPHLIWSLLSPAATPGVSDRTCLISTKSVAGLPWGVQW